MSRDIGLIYVSGHGSHFGELGQRPGSLFWLRQWLHAGCFDARHARLIVDGSGPLLGQNSVAQLAQPFRRLGTDRTGSQNGHGLGLSIVAAVAAAHDGTLELKARPDGGLHVQITLPAATTIADLAKTIGQGSLQRAEG